MAAVFRFPNGTIAADPTQKVAIKAPDGRFYSVMIQDILDLAAAGSLPSVTDDGTTVTVDGNLTVTTGNTVLLHLPTADPAVAGQLWANAGVVTVSAG